MAKQGMGNIVDIKKKFDVVTETLNIFDLSFLVSGSAMLGLCFYAFPAMNKFFVHGNQLFISVLLCVLFSYILGLICRILGKGIAQCYGDLSDRYLDQGNALIFLNYFDQIFARDSAIVKAVSSKQEKENIAYSYMWMRLDTSENVDCRNRFLYVSRIWVLRAIYEGLIPSVIFLSVIILCNGDLCSFSNKVFGGYLAYLGVPVIMVFDLIVVALLAEEARHCDATLRREVVVAYFDFFGKKENETPGKDKEAEREV